MHERWLMLRWPFHGSAFPFFCRTSGTHWAGTVPSPLSVKSSSGRLFSSCCSSWKEPSGRDRYKTDIPAYPGRESLVCKELGEPELFSVNLGNYWQTDEWGSASVLAEWVPFHAVWGLRPSSRFSYCFLYISEIFPLLFYHFYFIIEEIQSK